MTLTKLALNDVNVVNIMSDVDSTRNLADGHGKLLLIVSGALSKMASSLHMLINDVPSLAKNYSL